MEIKTRSLCQGCNGSGKNDLTDVEAYEAIDRMQISMGNMMDKKIQMQKCTHCVDGYNYKWVGLNELLSMRI